MATEETLADRIRHLKGVLSVKGAADLLGISADGVHRAIDRGTLKATLTLQGRKPLYQIEPQDLADYDERRRTPVNEKTKVER